MNKIEYPCLCTAYSTSRFLFTFCLALIVFIIIFGFLVGWYIGHNQYMADNDCVLVHEDQKEQWYFCRETGELLKR